MSEDVEMVLCVPVRDLPAGDEDAGSEVRWCMLCGEPVWCAHNTLVQLDRRPKMQVWCNACGVPLVDAEPEKKLSQVPGDRRSKAEVRALWQDLLRRHGTGRRKP